MVFLMAAPASTLAHPVATADWGRTAYAEAQRRQEEMVAQRIAGGIGDTLVFTEHEPVFTLGLRSGADTHLVWNAARLAREGVAVARTNRGGDITYHGPGQIVAYPLFDLRRLGIGVRELVNRIEQSIIDTLAGYRIEAQRRDGAPGVYVGAAKIAALGLRVRRGCSFHGLAFNVAMDLEPFARINPCGYQGLAVTQVIDCGGPGALPVVAADLVDAICAQFGFAATTVEPRLPEPADA